MGTYLECVDDLGHVLFGGVQPSGTEDLLQVALHRLSLPAHSSQHVGSHVLHPTTSLLLIDLDHIVLLSLQRDWRIRLDDAASVEHESQRGGLNSELVESLSHHLKQQHPP